MLLPGAGFDVVPSDCLAAHLKRRLPSATHLALGIRGVSSGPSRGTATTMIEGLGQTGLVRRNGKLTSIPMGSLTRQIDYGRGPVASVAIPWGDVSTAFFSTGIPNIEVYFAYPASMRRALSGRPPCKGCSSALSVPAHLGLVTNNVQKARACCGARWWTRPASAASAVCARLMATP